jgi:hypothetical protein
MGHIILGTAFKKHPELNETGLYADLDLNPNEHNKCWEDFSLQRLVAWTGALPDLLYRFDSVVEKVARTVGEILKRSGKLVAGSLRIYVSFRPVLPQNTEVPVVPVVLDNSVILTLVWVHDSEENRGETECQKKK